jgi:hypothetical protein
MKFNHEIRDRYICFKHNELAPTKENSCQWIYYMLDNIQGITEQCDSVIKVLFNRDQYGNGFSFLDDLAITYNKNNDLWYIYYYPENLVYEYVEGMDYDDVTLVFQYLKPHECLKIRRDNLVEILEDWKKLMSHTEYYPFIFIWEDPITKWIRIKPCASEAEIDENIKKYGLS